MTHLAENDSVHSNESRNTYSPSFQLKVDYVLQELPEEERAEEAAQVSICGGEGMENRHLTANADRHPLRESSHPQLG